MRYLYVMDLQAKTRHLQEVIDVMFIGLLFSNKPLEEAMEALTSIIKLGAAWGVDIKPYINDKIANYSTTSDTAMALYKGLSAMLDKVDENKFTHPSPSLPKGGDDHSL